MAQWLTYLPCKFKDLSSNSQSPNRVGMVACVCNSSTLVGRDKGIPSSSRVG